jgi:hypothetical protein
MRTSRPKETQRKMSDFICVCVYLKIMLSGKMQLRRLRSVSYECDLMIEKSYKQLHIDGFHDEVEMENCTKCCQRKAEYIRDAIEDLSRGSNYEFASKSRLAVCIEN